MSIDIIIMAAFFLLCQTKDEATWGSHLGIDSAKNQLTKISQYPEEDVGQELMVHKSLKTVATHKK